MITPRSQHEQASVLLTSYILGMLDRDEDTFVTAHLGRCADCDRELIGLTDTLMALDMLDPADVWDA
ncbi:zf-HC2 domain-containing protein [Streptomyces sp. NPDC060022]|uniref:zf-HC2 domain-containing protein n=1 Tax=Streptomyces sp. NPDC060022 TaxID=3347039 RepID=UPI0036A62EDE